MFTASRLATGLAQPLFLTSPPGDASRLFVLEQKTGSIRIIDAATGTINETPFLTIPPELLLTPEFEQGLLGLAFHPDYATNGRFYVNYTAPGPTLGGTTRIVEYRVSASNPNIADPLSARSVLSYAQPENNHNGGWMAFGPDGYLYISSGDGGGNGFQSGNLDLSANSQDLTDNLLGKILRIDVNGDGFPQDPSRNYRIPADNPFVGITGDDEIWSYGLRNPWRPSFDPATGELYIADVGQGAREEINIQPAGVGGQNYGWPFREGDLDYRPAGAPGDLTAPAFTYPHSIGQSVTGGYVYRGSVESLGGTYFFADFITGRIYSFRYVNGVITEYTDRTSSLAPPPGQGSINNISSFGEDSAGNLYLVDYDGDIFRLNVSAPTPPPSGTTFLSDLTPTVAINGWGPYERDRSNGETGPTDGGPLTLNGTTYAKGLGVHASSALTYSLDGLYSRFQSFIGVDDYVGDRGSVVFRVIADGAEIFTSEILTGSSDTQFVDLDVAGVQTLELIVDTADGSDAYDHANWADAKLLDAPAPPSVYLSDLTPTVAINGWGPYERDRSNGETGPTDGGPLTLNGTTYAKGLGVHASSSLTYSLDGLYSRFQSFIGIDDYVGDRGSVVFRVLADGNEIFTSDTLTGTSTTQFADLDVEGVQTLELIVDTADGSDAYDHANWADAKLLDATAPPSATSPPTIGEYGTLSLNHTWQTVNLTGTYINPVVVASDPSLNGLDPAAVRIRNVNDTSFEIRLQEPNVNDGTHVFETVSWIVIEAGDHQFADGTRLSAGTVDTNLLSPQGFEGVGFGTGFSTAPTVLSQIQTFNGSDWAITRTDAVTGSTFQVTMQEEERLNGGSHVTETIGWLAIAPGIANDGDTLMQASTTSDSITHNPAAISFAQSFSATPALIAKLSSFDGSNPANLRFFSLTASGFTALAAEEKSLDNEVNHVTERASYLALAGSAGTIEAFAV